MIEDFKLVRIVEERQNSKNGETVSPATVNRALTTLKLIFNRAAKDGSPISNPTNAVAFLEEGEGQIRVISFEEELAYFQAASQPLRDIAPDYAGYRDET